MKTQFAGVLFRLPCVIELSVREGKTWRRNPRAHGGEQTAALLVNRMRLDFRLWSCPVGEKEPGTHDPGDVRSVVCDRFCIVRTGASHPERSATESCRFASVLNERFVFATLASQFL